MDKHQFGVAPASWATAPPSALAWDARHPHESSLQFAGFWRRFLASAIDGFVVSIVSAILTGILDDFLGPLLPLILIDWLYYAGLESSSWQATLGKRALGIAVTDLAGSRISFGRATGRYFARYISVVTFLIGYLIQPFTRKRQTLHDLIAGTLVVRA